MDTNRTHRASKLLTFYIQYEYADDDNPVPILHRKTIAAPSRASIVSILEEREGRPIKLALVKQTSPKASEPARQRSIFSSLIFALFGIIALLMVGIQIFG